MPALCRRVPLRYSYRNPGKWAVQRPGCPFGDTCEQSFVRNLAVDQGVAQLVLPVHKGVFVAVYGLLDGCVTDDMGDHLQAVLLGKLAVFLHLIVFDPFQAVILSVNSIAVPHQSRSRPQAAVLEELQRPQGQPGILSIFAAGELAFRQIGFEGGKVVKADLMPVPEQGLPPLS